jgi:hypothetical protein
MSRAGAHFLISTKHNKDTNPNIRPPNKNIQTLLIISGGRSQKVYSQPPTSLHEPRPDVWQAVIEGQLAPTIQSIIQHNSPIFIGQQNTSETKFRLKHSQKKRLPGNIFLDHWQLDPIRPFTVI